MNSTGSSPSYDPVQDKGSGGRLCLIHLARGPTAIDAVYLSPVTTKLSSCWKTSRQVASSPVGNRKSSSVWLGALRRWSVAQSSALAASCWRKELSKCSSVLGYGQSAQVRDAQRPYWCRWARTYKLSHKRSRSNWASLLMCLGRTRGAWPGAWDGWPPPLGLG